ncbi:MAG: hypothetical protein WCF85_18980 [Rhodospirillaceae bacterium]
MGTTNAERQAKHRQRLKAEIESLRNGSDGDVVALRAEIARLKAELVSAYGCIAELRGRVTPAVRHEVFTRKGRPSFYPDWALIDEITAAMDARKLTRGGLSKALEIPPASLKQFLNGRQCLKAEHLAAVRAHLGLRG